MASVWQQQVFALDAKYNAYRDSAQPNFRTQYIRRRSQLLREFTKKEDSAIRRQYVKLRTQLLQQRYGSSYSDQTSLRSQSLSIRSSSRVSESPDSNLPSLYDDSKQSSHHYGPKSNAISTIPTKQGEASRPLVGGKSVADNYAFVGVHYIFDQHKSAVTMVKFANNDRSRLCCTSTDGKLSLCNVTSSPPSVEAVLEGHTGPVTGCDWSSSNDLIVSSSGDATIRLWEVSCPLPRCLRCVADPGNARVLCCAFLPANSNLVIAGNDRGILQLLNISTGIYPRNGGCKMGGKVLAIACESTGRVVWAGNDKGDIASFLFDVGTGRLKKCKTFKIAENCAITCLSWRAWMPQPHLEDRDSRDRAWSRVRGREARDPTLLVNCATNAVCIFRILHNGSLQLLRKYAVRHKVHLLQSTFCPIMSFRQGACVVTGSEDCCVYFLDIDRESSKCVNKLQGHACPVLSVAFNYDESLLASSDVQGLVIIWKRDQQLLPT